MILEFISKSAVAFGLPFVSCYFALQSNLFLMTANSEATGLEKWGNSFLTPCHYLFVGKQADRGNDGEWIFSNQYEYETDFAYRTIFYSIAVIPTLPVGICLKGLSFITESARNHHKSMTEARSSTTVVPHSELYRTLGISMSQGRLQPLGLTRRPGDEKVLEKDKEALKDIAALLDEAQIPWWLDCGACLGAYRYGGVIPWDEDLDVAILRPDFENVRRLLNRLDPTKYIVEDWSSRSHPNCFLRVLVRESGNPLDKRIDIYNYDVDTSSKMITWVFSPEHNIFIPDDFKEQESKYKVPTPLALVFPLQRATFDGIEVNVPHDTVKYLQRVYGENLDPIKVYNPQTNQYEKDPSHPYWKIGFRH